MSASPDILVGSFAAENQSVFRARLTLTDGGSEFQGQFARLIRESPVIEQWLTYPKCPKMNAHIKRFNRTVQEDCIDHAENLLFTDMEAFNDRLWNRFVFVGECSAFRARLTLHRPHAGNGQKASTRMLLPNASSEALQKSHLEWHRTIVLSI